MTMRILVDPSFPLGKVACQAASLIIEGTAKLKRLQAAINRMAAVTSGDPTYVQIEIELGLDPGEGIVLLNLLADAGAALDHPAIKAFTERVDQG